MDIPKQRQSKGLIKIFFGYTTGVIGSCFILLTTLMAVFAYVIAPDSTPSADRQHIEIRSQSPGFTQEFLYIPDTSIPATGFFSLLIKGAPDRGKYLPIQDYAIGSDSIIVQKYIAPEISERHAFPISLFESEGKNLTSYIRKHRFYLGTDGLGRDMLSRLLVGSRISLMVGLLAVLISVAVGFVLGAMGGYFGGRADRWVVWLMGVMWSIPTLLLVFAFTLITGKGMWQIFIAIGLTMWVSTARLIRNQVLSLKEQDFIQSAVNMGFSPLRIIFKHLLPNLYGLLIVAAVSNFAVAIMIEAGLSFLGLGVQPPEPSWGLMIKENYLFLITDKPMLALVPGLAIMLLVLSFNMMGNALRDALDIQS
jgi:peptide/nickel transport system permease protein